MKTNQHSSWLRYTTLSVFAFFAFMITLNAQTRDSFRVAGTFQWTAPCNVTAIQVETWGSGGGGGFAANGGSTFGRAGGGGAGGAYVRNTSITVVPGTTYNITVGAAGTGGTSSATSGTAASGNSSSFSGSGITTITAVGGAGGGSGSAASPGAGGVGSNSLNAGFSSTFNYAGGSGAAGVTSSYSGGGGAAAGNSASGNNASASTKGTGANGGGDGGDGRTTAANASGASGVAGVAPGGGGSGGYQGSTGTNTRNGGAGGVGRVIISYTVSSSTICTSGTLSALSTTNGVASSNTSFVAFASGLSANLALAAPSGFEISTSAGSGFASSLSLTPTNGVAAPTTVYVRLASTTPAGTYSGDIVLSSSGASSVNVATVSSIVAPPAPALSVSPTTINFTATVAGTPTSATVVTVTAANLTSNITINAPSGFEVSLSNAPFSALSLPYSSYSSAGGTVYVRFNPSIGGSYNFTSSNGISFAATGVSTQYINVTGAATSAEPITASTASFGTVTSSSIVVNFSGGNGSNRIVVLKSLTTASYTPTDGTAISGVNSDFTLATDQGSGNKVVYDGTGNTVTVTNLPPGLYYVSVIEYNTAGPAATNNYLTSSRGTGNTYTLTTSGNTSYPIIGDANGGFEAQTTGTMISGSSSATALNTSLWTASTATNMTRTVTGTGGRSGPKYVTAGPTSSTTTNKTIYSPQIADIVLPNKTYQVQFFYKNPNAGAPSVNTFDLYANNTSLSGTPPPGTVQSSNISLSNSVSSWTKFTTSITTNTIVAPTTNNVFGITMAQPGTSTTYLVDYDDYVIYEGNAVDNTAPNSPASVNATGSTGSINVSWTAPSGGVDGGGYVVVRYLSNPNANDDPLQNGIYAVGNTIIGSVAGTVRYIGTSTSFTDNVNIVGASDYYYKVYAVDKAYNYSAETQFGPVQSLITTYYYAGTGSLANTNNWGTSTDGSGTKPLDFITDAQKFEIRNTSAVSTDVPWTVSGASSKVVLGDATVSAVTLTIASGAGITGPFDIAAASSGANSLIVNDAVLPVIGTCDPNSEVHIRTSLTSGNAGTYGKVFIENNAIDSLTGTPSIRNLTIDAGATLISGTATGNYIVIPSGGSVIVNGKIATAKTPGLVSSIVTTPGISFATLQFVGAANLTFGSSSTVDFSKIATSTTQTIDALTYANLTLSGTSPKTFAAGTLTVSGNFTITSTGTLTQPSATSIVLNGSSSQAIPIQLTSFSNLSVCGGTKTMSANSSVTGVLNLNCGIIQTGANTLSITSTGSVTRTSGWIFGNLSKFVATGSNVTRAFEIGDASNYSPITAIFNSVTTAGDLVATVTSPITASPNYGTMPHIATANGYINKYWTLTNANSLAFNNYTAAITFASGDVVDGATAATVTVNQYTNAWASHTPTYTGNTDSVFGLTGLGTFTLVVPCTIYTPSVSISSTSTAVCTGSSVTLTATPTNGGSAPSYQWKKNATNVGTNSITLVLQDNQVTGDDVITCVLTANNICQTSNTATSNGITLLVGTVTPSISISQNTSPICSGSSSTFTATGSNAGPAPIYTWKRNNITAGSGTSITFLAGTLAAGDTISCVLTANNTCQTIGVVTSNKIGLTVSTSPTIGGIINYKLGGSITAKSLCAIGDTVFLANYSATGVWASSNATNASVTTLPYGNGRISYVLAKAAGTATISYNTTASSGCVSGSAVAITVAPITAPAAITGASAVCTGSTIALATTATSGVWSSTAPSYASVNTSGVVTGISAGALTIRYTISNSAGCIIFSEKSITANALPATPSIGYKAPFSNPQAGAPTGGFCVGKVFGVLGTPTSGVWSSTGCISVTSLGVATINTTGAGSLTYTFTNSNSCANSRTMTGAGFACAARGVTVNNEKLETRNEFTIFPNPAISYVKLQVETLVGQGQIIVTDLYGKTVKIQPLSMGNNTVDIANLSKGMYFISIITNEGKTTKKLVVE